MQFYPIAEEVVGKGRNDVPVLTFIRSLDNHLGGGLPRGRGFVELVGPPASGKTDFVLQTALMTLVPESLGGVDGSSIIIDTMGSFSYQRIWQIAKALSEHLENLGTKIGVEEMLNKVTIIRTFDRVELLNAVTALPRIAARQKTTLVAIDSLAFPFRAMGKTDFADRHRELKSISSILNKLSHDDGCVVLVVNSLTTRFDGERAFTVPALGATWGHQAALRLSFMQSSGENNVIYRSIALSKCPWAKPAVMEVVISDCGLRAV